MKYIVEFNQDDSLDYQYFIDTLKEYNFEHISTSELGFPLMKYKKRLLYYDNAYDPAFDNTFEVTFNSKGVDIVNIDDLVSNSSSIYLNAGHSIDKQLYVAFNYISRAMYLKGAKFHMGNRYTTAEIKVLTDRFLYVFLFGISIVLNYEQMKPALKKFLNIPLDHMIDTVEYKLKTYEDVIKFWNDFYSYCLNPTDDDQKFIYLLYNEILPNLVLNVFPDKLLNDDILTIISIM